MKKKNIEKSVQKELIEKFKEENVFHVAKNTFLIVFKGECFKIIKVKEKGTHDEHDKVLNLAIHHGICGEIWTYSTDNKRTIKEIDVLYKGFL